MLMTYDEMQTILASNNLHTYQGNDAFSVYSSDEGADFELREGDPVDWVAPMNLLDYAGRQRFTALLAAIEALELQDLFTGSAQYTFFAPDDDAFAARCRWFETYPLRNCWKTRICSPIYWPTTWRRKMCAPIASASCNR